MTTMSIMFVDSIENTQKHSLVEVGLRIVFTTINGLVKPCEIIEPDGSSVSIGILVAA